MASARPGRNDPCHCGSGKKYKQCCQGKDSTPSAVPPDPAIAGLLREAIAHHQAARLPEAEARYQQVLQLAPSHPDALHLLGVLASQVGKYEIAAQLIAQAIGVHPTAPMYFNLGNALKGQGALDMAIDSYQQALALQPDYADALRNLGLAYREQGQADQAIASFRRALALSPRYAQVHANLGLALKEAGQAPAALASYQRAIALDPGLAEAHNNLGVLLKEQGQLHAAVDSYQKAIALQPAYAEALANLGNAFMELDLPARAAEVLGQAVRLQPGFAEGHSNLGNAFKALGELDAALASYGAALALQPGLAVAHNNRGTVLAQQGRLEEAAAAYRHALGLKPGYVEAHYNLGNALKDLAQFDAAAQQYLLALALRPEYAEAWSNLGNVQKAQSQLDEAIASYTEALRLKPGLAVTHSNLGMAWLDQGRFAEAIACARQALALQPDYPEAHSNLLFAMCFGDRAGYFAEAQRFGARAQAAARPFDSWRTRPAAAPLRVGLVSGDLRAHPVAFFLDGLLRQLDPARIELYAYVTEPNEDGMSARIKPHFCAWRSIVHMDDAQAAQLVQADGIDILFDLAGHTAHNRLPLFAWKPAPVQASWLGYFASTGLPAMDYLLGDDLSMASGEQFSETLYRLPGTRLCFTAPVDEVAVSPLPALANGHVTFGCFQNLSKVSDAVLALWQRVFAQLPGARLHMQSRQLGSPAARHKMQQRLAAAGIDPARVTLEGYVARQAYLQAHAGVDLILDTFPYPGGTTTCEALWMGVPTVTLAGDTMLARQGAGMLACAGLGDWVANDANAYVATALAKAGDVAALAQLRSSLRAQVLASPLFDAPRFARQFEQACEAMWAMKMGAAVLH